jgi:hypothetical protein
MVARTGRLAVAVGLVVAAAGLQFDLDVGRSKCIGEVMGKHDVAKGKYRIEGLAEGSRSGFEVKITGPAGDLEYQQSDAVTGKFAFTASEAGAHRVCFTNAGAQSRRVNFEFLSGVDAKDYSGERGGGGGRGRWGSFASAGWTDESSDPRGPP